MSSCPFSFLPFVEAMCEHCLYTSYIPMCIKGGALDPRNPNNHLLALTATVIAQFLLGLLWFSVIFAAPWCRAFVADKGSMKRAVPRYNALVGCAVSLYGYTVRAVAIYALLHAAGRLTPGPSADLCTFLQAGLMVFAVQTIGVQTYLWSHRPLLLLAVETGFELAASLIAPAALYHYLSYVA